MVKAPLYLPFKPFEFPDAWKLVVVVETAKVK